MFRMDGTPLPSVARLAVQWLSGRVPAIRRPPQGVDLHTAYCAEVLAVTFQEMGLLPGRRRPSWYDAGRFWASGDDLRLSQVLALGGEIAVRLPAVGSGEPRASTARG